MQYDRSAARICAKMARSMVMNYIYIHVYIYARNKIEQIEQTDNLASCYI